MRALVVLAVVLVLLWLLSKEPAAAATKAPSTGTGAQNPAYISDINAVAQAEGVPAAVLFGIAATEQGTPDSNQWNPNAVNLSDPYGGAWGLTQVLAGTGAELGIELPQELLSPVEALTATAKYLRKYSTNVDNIEEDAQLYNAGPNANFVDTAYIEKVVKNAALWPTIAGAA